MRTRKGQGGHPGDPARGGVARQHFIGRPANGAGVRLEAPSHKHFTRQLFKLVCLDALDTSHRHTSRARYFINANPFRDALLSEITIETQAPAGTFVLRGQQGADSWAEQLVRAGQEGYLAVPAVLVVTTLATAVETLAMAFECVFTFGVSCGDEPERTLDTFPAALPAGQQDSFELAVHGTGEPGDEYTADLTFTGQNYCPVRLRVDVEIVAPEP